MRQWPRSPQQKKQINQRRKMETRHSCGEIAAAVPSLMAAVKEERRCWQIRQLGLSLAEYGGRMSWLRQRRKWRGYGANVATASGADGV